MFPLIYTMDETEIDIDKELDKLKLAAGADDIEEVQDDDEEVARMNARLQEREQDYDRLRCIVRLYDETIRKQMRMIEFLGSKCEELKELYCHE